MTYPISAFRRTLILTILGIILLPVSLYSQAPKFRLPITVTESTATSATVRGYIGIHPDATYCTGDSLYGFTDHWQLYEPNFPPADPQSYVVREGPPAGPAFDVRISTNRWRIPPCGLWLTDWIMVNKFTSASEIDTFIIKITPDPGGPSGPITVAWPSVIGEYCDSALISTTHTNIDDGSKLRLRVSMTQATKFVDYPQTWYPSTWRDTLIMYHPKYPSPPPPGNPSAIYPADGQMIYSISPTLRWTEGSPSTQYYHLQVSKSPIPDVYGVFPDFVFNDTLSVPYKTIPWLHLNTTYYWRVVAYSPYGVSYWQNPQMQFTTAATSVLPDSVELPIHAGWNAVAPIMHAVATDSITQSPSGIIASEYWEWNGLRASPAATIVPGTDYYWVYANGSGSITLRSNSCLTQNRPVFDSSPPSGSIVSAQAGVPLNLNIRASEPGGRLVTLQAESLPMGASMLPPLPAAGNPVESSFSWTPAEGDSGAHPVKFVATDSCGLKSTLAFSIMVETPDNFAVSLRIANVHNDTNTIFWGFASNATTCLDAGIGENSLPPALQEAQFWFPPTCPVLSAVGPTSIDLRPSSDFARVDTFNIQLPGGGYPLELSWSDLSRYSSGFVLLRIPVLAGTPPLRTYTFVNMGTQGSYPFLTRPPASDAQILASPHAGTVRVRAEEGWNMVSVPLETFGRRSDELFLHTTSYAFNYSGSGYVVADTMQIGMGYWLKFSAAESVGIIGLPAFTRTVPVRAGWNMIGSLGAKIAVTGIVADPPGMVASQFFGFSGHYVTVDTIVPGKACWVKVNQGGTLTLATTPMGSATRLTIVPTSDRPPSPPEEILDVPAVVQTPRVYALEEAYPNPLNPATTIRYQLPGASIVSLKIYNLLGQIVGILKDQATEEGGYKSARWNAGSLASGIYFYRLDATSLSDPSKAFTEIRKMVLVK